MLSRLNPTELFNQLPILRKTNTATSSSAATTIDSDNGSNDRQQQQQQSSSGYLTVDTTIDNDKQVDHNDNKNTITDDSKSQDNDHNNHNNKQSINHPKIIDADTNNDNKSTSNSATYDPTTYLHNTATNILTTLVSSIKLPQFSLYNYDNSTTIQQQQSTRAAELLLYIDRLKQCETNHKTNYDKLTGLNIKYKQLMIEEITQWKCYHIDICIQYANKLYGTWLQYLHELIELESSFLQNIQQHIEYISYATQIKHNNIQSLTIEQSEQLKHALSFASDSNNTFKTSDEIESSFWPTTAHIKKKLCLSLYESAKQLETQYNELKQKYSVLESVQQRREAIKNIIEQGIETANILNDDSLYYHTYNNTLQSEFTQRILDERTIDGQNVKKFIDNIRNQLLHNKQNTIAKQIISFLDTFTVDLKRRCNLSTQYLPTLRLYVDRTLFPYIIDMVNSIETDDSKQLSKQYNETLKQLQQHNIQPQQLGIQEQFLVKHHNNNNNLNNNEHTYDLYGYDLPIQLLHGIYDSTHCVPTDILRTISQVVQQTHICAANHMHQNTKHNNNEQQQQQSSHYIQADDFFPILTYIVIQSKCVKLPFLLSHVQSFLPENCTSFGQSGISLTQLDAAVRHIANIQIDKLLNNTYTCTDTTHSITSTDYKRKPSISHHHHKNHSSLNQYDGISRYDSDDDELSLLYKLDLNVSSDGSIVVSPVKCTK